MAGEPVVFGAQPEVEWAVLTAMIEDVDSGGRLASAQMKPSTDGWHDAELPLLPEGIYSLTLTGGREINPVTDLFTLVDIGTDIEA